MTDSLHDARTEAARLRETLDLLGVGICIIDRSADPVLGHANLAMHELVGVRLDTMADLVAALADEDAAALLDAMPDHAGGHLGSIAMRATGRTAAVTLHVLEADLHDSVALFFDAH